MSKVLMKGNEAIGEGAIRAGCRHFFGYPITPKVNCPIIWPNACRKWEASFYRRKVKLPLLIWFMALPERVSAP